MEKAYICEKYTAVSGVTVIVTPIKVYMLCLVLRCYFSVSLLGKCSYSSVYAIFFEVKMLFLRCKI